MIKGINRQIIEITETGNHYYERALLVIRPEYIDADSALLEREAKKILRDLDAPAAIKKKNRVLYWTLRLGGAAAVGAAFAGACLMI